MIVHPGQHPERFGPTDPARTYDLILQQFPDHLRRAAAHPDSFWSRQRRLIATGVDKSNPARRSLKAWVPAAAAALLALILTSYPDAHSPRLRQIEADHALLVEIEKTLRHPLPASLAPAALLAEELNLAASRIDSP